MLERILFIAARQPQADRGQTPPCKKFSVTSVRDPNLMPRELRWPDCGVCDTSELNHMAFTSVHSVTPFDAKNLPNLEFSQTNKKTQK